jgi:hypothetical protein
MKFVMAITSRLLSPRISINIAEDHLIRLRIGNVDRKDIPDLGTSAILERLQIDYKRRDWNEARVTIYRKRVDALIPAHGIEHEDTSRSILLLLRACGIGSQNHDLDQFLYTQLTASYEATHFIRRPRIESLRKAGANLNSEGYHEHAIKVFKWAWNIS